MDHSYNYSNICPSGAQMGEVTRFFEEFFRISDTPDVHEQYTRNFAENATFILASNTSKGREGENLISIYFLNHADTCIEILQTRTGMWSAVVSRRHTVHKIFPFGNNTNEVMLYGHVAYDLKNGGHSEKDWAARAVLTKSPDESLQLEFYQVYLVCVAIRDAVTMVLTHERTPLRR